uniref:Uncharacterized protein n=1 Tax=Tanacetum cinerariifolium TaxID=118510 RepID=A0A6L2M6S9_TANCI|nr:hypothetical protein [Tanacetum cinerariifolium]
MAAALGFQASVTAALNRDTSLHKSIFKIYDDLYFAFGSSRRWEVLYSRVNKHKKLIAELNVFGGPLALQCAEFFKQLSQTEVIKMLDIRNLIAEFSLYADTDNPS